MTNDIKKEIEKEPTKREKLEDFLINWTKEKHLPLVYENKKLKNEVERCSIIKKSNLIIKKLDISNVTMKDCDIVRWQWNIEKIINV